MPPDDDDSWSAAEMIKNGPCSKSYSFFVRTEVTSRLFRFEL